MQQERFFNNAGPNKPDINYTLPPLERLDLAEIEHYIAQQRYFVLHAPRQTGKTTTLLALAEYLRPTYRSLYVNIEIAQSAREDVYAAMQAIVGAIAAQACFQGLDEHLQAFSGSHALRGNPVAPRCGASHGFKEMEKAMALCAQGRTFG